LYSEYDNFRKRTVKEKMELVQLGGAEIIKSLLTVIDDLNRGRKAMDETDDINAIKEGL
jgi:molecular chaperone GrpE